MSHLVTFVIQWHFCRIHSMALLSSEEMSRKNETSLFLPEIDQIPNVKFAFIFRPTFSNLNE